MPAHPVAEDAGAGRSPWLFLVLVLLLAVPFWIGGGLADVQIMPGLPASALMIVVPVVLAAALAWREGGAAKVAALLRRAFDAGRIPGVLWLAPILLLRPAISLAQFAIARAMGEPVPDPAFDLGLVLALCAVFFVAALCEEWGWSAYALPPLEARWGWLGAALVLGLVWAVMHLVPLMQAGRSPAWMAWWTLGTLATRVMMVWLYVHGGRSLLAVTLFHMSQNVAWQLYPVRGSHFDPRLDGLLALAVAALLVVLTARRARP